MSTSLIRSKKYSVEATDLILEIPDVATYLVSCPATTSADIKYCMENTIIATPFPYDSAVFAVTANTITRTKGSWIQDNFVVGMTLTVTGTASNNVTGVITAVTEKVLTVGVVLANETTTAAVFSGVDDDATVWFTNASVVASAHNFTRSEFGPRGIRVTRTSGAVPVVVWVKS